MCATRGREEKGERERECTTIKVSSSLRRKSTEIQEYKDRYTNYYIASDWEKRHPVSRVGGKSERDSARCPVGSA